MIAFMICFAGTELHDSSSIQTFDHSGHGSIIFIGVHSPNHPFPGSAQEQVIVAYSTMNIAWEPETPPTSMGTSWHTPMGLAVSRFSFVLVTYTLIRQRMSLLI